MNKCLQLSAEFELDVDRPTYIGRLVLSVPYWDNVFADWELRVEDASTETLAQVRRTHGDALVDRAAVRQMIVHGKPFPRTTPGP